jgi:hypothetical protein
MVKSIRVWKVAFIAAAVVAYPAEAQDCLFADTGSVPPSQCRDDVYNVSTEPSVVRAVARLADYGDSYRITVRITRFR